MKTPETEAEANRKEQNTSVGTSASLMMDRSHRVPD